MGNGWRRAFCTYSMPRNSDVDAMSDEQITTDSPSPSPRSCTRFQFFSNPSTPRLPCRTTAPTPASNPGPHTPSLHCKTTTQKLAKSQRPLFTSSDSTSARSPLNLLLFRNSFLSRGQSNCGLCARGVKTGQGTAIYTAECGHAFHFPCIAAHVRKEVKPKLGCPVCSVRWKDVPLLAVQASSSDLLEQDRSIVAATKISTPRTQKIKDASPIQQYHHCQLQPVSVIRVYDDDESLLTPTAGGKFNPIQEAGEEEEVEEFRGFFVNPFPSCSVKHSLTNNSRTVDVRSMPEAAILSINQTHETYVIALRVNAPSTLTQPDQSRREPTDLVAVLDVSPCMNGSKLLMLKRAMHLVISSLGASDRLSIVSFSTITKRLIPLRRMTSQGQVMAKQIVDRLTCGQGSNAENALRKASKVLDDRRERNPVASIMLLSDGQIETQRRERSRVLSTRFAHVEISVHASGYSHNAAEDAFAKFIGGLLSGVVQDLRIKLKLDNNGADITAVYCKNSRPTLLGSDSIRLGDMYAEEERELLVEVRLPASIAGTKPILTSRCSYRDAVTMKTVTCREQTLILPKLRPIRSTAPKIERLRNLFLATRAIAEARGLAEQCDYANAQCRLMSARVLVLQSSSSEMAAGEYVRVLEIEMMELARRQQLEKHSAAIEMQRRRKKQDEWELGLVDENGDPLTPTSAWKAAEMLAKVAMKKKSLNKVSDLHGFESARF